MEENFEPTTPQMRTERVRGYTPRTIYRYSNKLAEVGVLERHEEPGVPSKVTHSLARPQGRELYELISAYAEASFTRLPTAGSTPTPGDRWRCWPIFGNRG